MTETETDSKDYRKGDVFWAPDPFKKGANPRLWLVIAGETLPYPGEEYVCLALTTSDLPANYHIDDDWVSGKDPEKNSYCSPWVVATVKHDDVANPQGKVTEDFADRMATECKQYL